MTNALVPAVPTELTPIDDAVEIGILYRRGREAFLEVGRRLIARKQKLKHGEWIPWLKENRENLGFGFNHANKLMAWVRKPDMDNKEAWGKKANSSSVRNLPKPVPSAAAELNEYLEWTLVRRKESGASARMPVDDLENIAASVAEVLASAVECSGYDLSKEDVRTIVGLVADLWGDEEIEAA